MPKCSWITVALLMLVSIGVLREGHAQMDTKKKPPKKVLAFYYGWYGNPQVSGKWVHWQNVDEAKKTIANSTHYPRLGAYDTHDPKVVEMHCRQAKDAGIDGLIATWWHPNDFHDKGMALLLDTAQKVGLEITVYYETVPNKAREKALEYVLYLLKTYGKHPAWLKVGGKAVVFVYGRAVGEIGLSGWQWVMSEANRQYDGGAAFIGDQISKRAARVFDGLHTYNITGATAGKSPDEIRQWAKPTFPQWVSTAGDRIACLTLIPGYDDSKLGRPAPRPLTARHGGATYRVLWEEAIAANPDWVILTSWNEWHEGSDIEPSVEHGDRELKTTAAFAPKFKALPPRQPVQRPSLVPEADRAALREVLKRMPIAVLRGADSEGFWFLHSLGVPATMLDWERVIDPQTFSPQKFPLALYASGEAYRPTVREQDDVLRALQRYVQDGGTLLVLPWLPMPFYQDEQQKKAVVHSQALGLPLTLAWEHPPADRTLTFVVRDRAALPHAPDRFAFPEAGDRRWRPLVPERAAQGTKVTVLLELLDETGKSHGAGAGLVQVGKGRILYAWFRLLDIPAAEALLHDLWRLAAGR